MSVLIGLKLHRCMAGLFFELYPPNFVRIHISVSCKSAEIFIRISQVVSDSAKINLSVQSISWGLLHKYLVKKLFIDKVIQYLPNTFSVLIYPACCLIFNLSLLKCQISIISFYFSAKTKGYVSMLLYIHLLGAVIMLAKLSPAILDYLDIFILSLEEQNIPKPLLWEWIWFGGSFIIFIFGGHALKASRAGKIQIFGLLVFLLGLLPILWGMLFLSSISFWTLALILHLQ